jgi:Putative prokaryotic signal transducing protein
MPSDAELVVVRIFSDRMEASLAQSALEAAGIQSLMRPDDVGGLRPHMSYTLGVEILVFEEDVAAARDILTLRARDLR